MAYGIVTVHHDVCLFLIFIIAFVYWFLYKVIVDFNYNTKGSRDKLALSKFSIFEFSSLNVKLYSFFLSIFLYYIKFFWYFVDYCELNTFIYVDKDEDGFVWTSLKNSNYKLFFCSLIWKLFSVILGLSHKNILVNSEGKICWNGLSLVDNFNVSDSDILHDFVSWNLKDDSLNYWFKEKLVSLQLFNYISSGYFYENLSKRYNFLSSRFNNLSLQTNTDLSSNLLRNLDDKFKLRYLFFVMQDFIHSLSFEYIWAVIPTGIIGTILLPSLILLYYSEDNNIYPLYTFKVIGHQWYWSYQFDDIIYLSDQSKYVSAAFNFDSNLITDVDFGKKRLLEVDNRLVVPVNVPLRFLVTSVMFYIVDQFLN